MNLSLKTRTFFHLLAGAFRSYNVLTRGFLDIHTRVRSPERICADQLASLLSTLMIAFATTLPLRLKVTVPGVSKFAGPASFSRSIRQNVHLPQRARFFSVASSATSQRVTDAIAANKIMIFTKSSCPYCATVKGLFKEIKAEFQSVELDKDPEGDAIKEELIKRTGQSSVPNVFINEKHIGGCDGKPRQH